MKKLAVLFLAIGLSSSTVFANNGATEAKEEGKALRTEIFKLVSKFDSDKTVSADVDFMVNKKGEIIVLSVDSENESLEKFVKATLNYKSVKNVVSKRMKVYKFPLKIIRE